MAARIARGLAAALTSLKNLDQAWLPPARTGGAYHARSMVEIRMGTA
jgi:hypothetical protein